MRRVGFALLILAAFTNIAAALEPRPAEGDPLPKGASTDKTYGYVETNPIKVGRRNGGPRAEELFLSALRGPDGQHVKYERDGSCCAFETPNAWVGTEGLLDMYEVKYEGLKEPIILFLNMYDYEQPKVPVGFTKAK
jgi:hypothetical protein